MDFDEPRSARREIVIGEPLDSLSIGELDERIAALKGEIERVEAEVKRKRSGREAADSLFRL